MVRDRTPAQLRAAWTEQGFYDRRDLYTSFREQVARRPDQVAVVDDLGSVSYRGLLSRAHRIANLLTDAGLGPGDVVAVQLPNSALGCAVDYAVAGVGAVSLPFPIHYRERELEHLLGPSRAIAYLGPREFGGHDFLAMMLGLRHRLPALRVLLVDGAPENGALSLSDALAGGTSDEWTPRPVDPAGPCRVFVTSGTEAAPKMVLFDHRAIGEPFRRMLDRCGITSSATVYPAVPLGSGMGSIVTSGILARHGARVIVTGTFDADHALGLVERHAVTHFYGVPAMVQMMLASPQFPSADMSSLRVVVTAGASLPEYLARRLHDDHGWKALSFYGCSDGTLCTASIDDPPERAATTVGRSDPGLCTVRIVDGDGSDLPPGQVGEVWGLGPFSPLSYLNSPELDERYRSPDGWVRSGDLGQLADDGYLTIVGRLKDIIIRGGFNISPTEIEDELTVHPAVLQAACVGCPDDRLGERVCAFLVLRPGHSAPTVESIGEFLLGRGLSRYKLPERIVVVDQLPTNPVGKVLRRVLREQVATVVAP